jgi:hypothetical protein
MIVYPDGVVCVSILVRITYIYVAIVLDNISLSMLPVMINTDTKTLVSDGCLSTPSSRL